MRSDWSVELIVGRGAGMEGVSLVRAALRLPTRPEGRPEGLGGG